MLRLPRQTPIDELRDKATVKFRESESVDVDWSDSGHVTSHPIPPSSNLSLYYRTVPTPSQNPMGAAIEVHHHHGLSPRARSSSISSTTTSQDHGHQSYTRIQSGEDWARALAGAAPGEKLVLRLGAESAAVETQ